MPIGMTIENKGAFPRQPALPAIGAHDPKLGVQFPRPRRRLPLVPQPLDIVRVNETEKCVGSCFDVTGL